MNMIHVLNVFFFRSHNKIVSINHEMFEKFPLLEILDLSGNHLPEIKKDMFRNATRLKQL